jgi:dolichyl-phosphate beta-glucosyltransferase
LRAEVPALVSSCEIRVVDDGSADDTAAIVEQLAAVDPRVVLQREPHRGKGAAVRAGMLASGGALRFMCDADLSMPVRELARFLEAVPARADVAIGSREGAGARRVGEPAYRHVLGRLFNGAIKRIVFTGIDDTQCGFKLFTAEAARSIFSRTTIDGWAFDVEALYLARLQGLRIEEIPIEWHYGDDSRVSPLVDPLRMLRDVWAIRRRGGGP